MRSGEFTVETATVRCKPGGRRAVVPVGTVLLDAIHQTGLPLGQGCDGVALCGFCRVTVTSGAGGLSPVTAGERSVLSSLHAEIDERLACCARVEGDVSLTTSYW